MNAELEDALRDKIDDLTAQLAESTSRVEKLMSEMRNFVIVSRVIWQMNYGCRYSDMKVYMP